MADGVRKFESAKKVTVIPNMSKIDVFWPREKNEKLIKQLKLKKIVLK